MRFAGICMLAALGAVSQAARADLPISGAVLGQLEAVLKHCGRVSPGSAERYKRFAKVLIGNAKEKDLAAARSSAEYSDAYDSTTDELGKLPKEESKKACLEGLQSVVN